MMEVVGGKTDRFGILYERYKAPIYGYFFKLTSGDSQTSEDLSHNVFYKALKYKYSFKGTGTFAKWLFSIAHNLAIDHLKKKSRSVQRELSQKDLVEESNEQHVIQKNEELSILREALKMLDFESRELIVLSKIKCLKYIEIADMLNCTEGAIKARVFRALKKLREVYVTLEMTYYERAGF